MRLGRRLTLYQTGGAGKVGSTEYASLPGGMLAKGARDFLSISLINEIRTRFVRDMKFVCFQRKSRERIEIHWNITIPTTAAAAAGRGLLEPLVFLSATADQILRFCVQGAVMKHEGSCGRQRVGAVGVCSACPRFDTGKKRKF